MGISSIIKKRQAGAPERIRKAKEKKQAEAAII